MSDYPMLISNKLHSFRNFGKTNIQNKNAKVKTSAFLVVNIRFFDSY